MKRAGRLRPSLPQRTGSRTRRLPVPAPARPDAPSRRLAAPQARRRLRVRCVKVRCCGVVAVDAALRGGASLAASRAGRTSTPLVAARLGPPQSHVRLSCQLLGSAVIAGFLVQGCVSTALFGDATSRLPAPGAAAWPTALLCRARLCRAAPKGAGAVPVCTVASAGARGDETIIESIMPTRGGGVSPSPANDSRSCPQIEDIY